jgi:hypothetical protein
MSADRYSSLSRDPQEHISLNPNKQAVSHGDPNLQIKLGMADKLSKLHDSLLNLPGYLSFGLFWILL